MKDSYISDHKNTVMYSFGIYKLLPETGMLPNKGNVFVLVLKRFA